MPFFILFFKEGFWVLAKGAHIVLEEQATSMSFKVGAHFVLVLFFVWRGTLAVFWRPRLFVFPLRLPARLLRACRCSLPSG